MSRAARVGQPIAALDSPRLKAAEEREEREREQRRRLLNELAAEHRAMKDAEDELTARQSARAAKAAECRDAGCKWWEIGERMGNTSYVNALQIVRDYKEGAA